MKETRTMNEVAEFHRTFNHPILFSPGIPVEERVRLRINLLKEELDEFIFAAQCGDIIGVADALADLQYVLTGAVLEFGLHEKFPALCSEVHRSNMSKACSTKDEAFETCDSCDEPTNICERDGKFFVYRMRDDKTIKSVNYSPANIKSILYGDQNGH